MPRFVRAAVLVTAALLVTVPQVSAQPASVIFEAPAGKRPAGPISLAASFDRVLPSGRIIHPSGTSVVTGMNALGVALSPDGRFAIVTNDTERQDKTTSLLDGASTGGYSLAVVDTATMHVVDRYREGNEQYFAGIVALTDPANAANTLVLASGGGANAVWVFDLSSAGALTPDAHHIIPIPGAGDTHLANFSKAFPGTLVVSPTTLHAYVVNNLGNSVAEIDVANRTVVGAPLAVGFFPFGAALTNWGLLVANEGLTQYAKLPAPLTAPPFAAITPDIARSSSISVVGLQSDESLDTVRYALALERGPDGLHDIGGIHPTAIVAMRSKPFAFVALSGVDRIATVGLGGTEPRAVGGTELRLYDRGPYGTQPVALALSGDERRLYVALAGINAVAVLDVTDPSHPHRLGLIPTGWYPTALALSRDGRYLFVTNAKGFGEDRGFTGDQADAVDAKDRVLTVTADSNAIWATLERIDLDATSLRKTTPLALACLRAIRPLRGSERIVPKTFGSVGSAVIKHVVFVLEENKTFDAMLGDLKDARGRQVAAGNPQYVSYDVSVTPNLHALARTFGVATNYYADSEESDAGHQFAAGGIASNYTERTLLVKNDRRPLVNKNEDPEDYPRAGYIFNSLALRGKTYRDYGDLIRVSGYDEGKNNDPRADDPHFPANDDPAAPTSGLGGLYSLDVPAPLALAGHVDLDYPGWNLRIRDTRRAAEFIRDMDPLAKADQMPAFTYVWLPDDHTGAGKNIPPLPEEVADGDRALGQIVEYLTHLPQWQSTAIFITPDDAQSTRDHVNSHRSYAILVSPWAKRGYQGHKHLSTVSILKTEEELLGLPALSLGDALATDMSDFFTGKPNNAPFTHIDVPTQTASVEGERIAALLERTDESGPDADERAPVLQELSRAADRLARERATMPQGAYLAKQDTLYRRALDVLR